MIKNNLPNPDEVSPEINKEIKDFITEIFKTRGRLEFYDVSEYFAMKIEEKDLPRTMISGYYIINMIMASNKSDKDKMELIDGIVRDVQELSFSLEAEKV